ncbi:MAG: SprT family zinc-dependent metalloprotease [Pseudomonadota bacterium]|nr:SprT family zinc-dependent metalloprotease [Pseudomonadota bacterium]
MRPMRQLLLDLLAPATPPAPPNDSQPERPFALVPTAQAAIEEIAKHPPAPTGPPLALPDALAPVRFAHPRASREIVLGHARVAYEFKRGQRRTIGFAVSAEGLSVSAPRLAPLAAVEAALRDKARWIVAKLAQAQERQQRLQAMRIDWRAGSHLPYLGAPLTLVLDPRQRHGPGGAVLVPADAALPGSPAALHIGLPHSASAEQLRDVCQAWLMRQARRLFTQRLDHFAPQLGVRWQKMSLSSASTRWGSASADGAIRLNWRLIHFSQPLIDYVVVHELAHLREMNHSPRFWQTVQSVMPDYAARRGQLKDEAVPQW